MTVKRVTPEEVDAQAEAESAKEPATPVAVLDLHGDYAGIPQVIDKETHAHLKKYLPADLWDGYHGLIDARLASHEEGLAISEKLNKEAVKEAKATDAKAPDEALQQAQATAEAEADQAEKKTAKGKSTDQK